MQVELFISPSEGLKEFTEGCSLQYPDIQVSLSPTPQTRFLMISHLSCQSQSPRSNLGIPGYFCSVG